MVVWKNVRQQHIRKSFWEIVTKILVKLKVGFGDISGKMRTRWAKKQCIQTKSNNSSLGRLLNPSDPPKWENLQVTKSQDPGIPGASEKAIWDLAIVHGRNPGVTALIALQGFTCCSHVEHFMLDVFVHPLDFLVLPIKDLYCALLPALAVPSCSLHDVAEPVMQLWTDKEPQVPMC